MPVRRQEGKRTNAAWIATFMTRTLRLAISVGWIKLLGNVFFNCSVHQPVTRNIPGLTTNTR